MKLYDKPRYPFDEEQLFHHFGSEKERLAMETKMFPWWKPVFVGTPCNYWAFRRVDGAWFNWHKMMDHSPDGLFPEYVHNLGEAANYHWSPVFFIHWAKAVVYDRSLALWRETEAKQPKDVKPDKVAKLCDAEVAKWFESLKDCTEARITPK